MLCYDIVLSILLIKYRFFTLNERWNLREMKESPLGQNIFAYMTAINLRVISYKRLDISLELPSVILGHLPHFARKKALRENFARKILILIGIEVKFLKLFGNEKGKQTSFSTKKSSREVYNLSNKVFLTHFGAPSVEIFCPKGS